MFPIVCIHPYNLSSNILAAFWKCLGIHITKFNLAYISDKNIITYFIVSCWVAQDADERSLFCFLGFSGFSTWHVVDFDYLFLIG